MNRTLIAVMVAGMSTSSAWAVPQGRDDAAAITMPGKSAPPSKTATQASADKEAKRGYWFYKKPKEPEPTEEAQVEAQTMKPMSAPPKEPELLKLPPKQVEKMIEDYREYALYTMEPEKVRWYYEMVDFARRRARAFMNVTEVVMLSNSTLNMNTEYPVNAPGTNARIARRESTISTRLNQEGRNAALIMLTSKGCGYCDAQRGILKFFQQKYGWMVREVDIQEHPEAVTRFGTTSTPSVFLIVKESQDWMPVAVGVEALPKIEENSYRALRMLRGETTAQQWTTNEYEDGGLLDPQRK